MIAAAPMTPRNDDYSEFFKKLLMLNAAGHRFLGIDTRAETEPVISDWLNTLFTPDNQPGAMPTLPAHR